MQPLTERQQAILEYIQQAIDEKGYPPTLREIGARMDNAALLRRAGVTCGRSSARATSSASG